MQVRGTLPSASDGVRKTVKAPLVRAPKAPSRPPLPRPKSGGKRSK
jgi:hypothetical protein